MINAQTAKKKVESVKQKEQKIREIQWKKDDEKRNRAKARAKKETLPSVLKFIEKQINGAISAKNNYCYINFEPWMEGSLLAYEVEKVLTKLGYEVEIRSYTPTTGGDPDSGEGAERCGPTTYSCDISWKKD
jgi:hypothetical protein